MANKIFNFEKKVGWGEIIAIIALVVGGFSLYLQYLSNRADVSIHNDKLISAVFTDKDGVKRFFGYQRATIVNNGNKPVTLLGLEPHEDLGLILTQEEGSSYVKRTNLKYKIFEISDTILSEQLFKQQKNLWRFQDEGLEKLSFLNKVINPGQVYSLNIGTVYDLYSDTNRHYKSIIFSSQLKFSNGQKLLFGVADNNVPK